MKTNVGVFSDPIGGQVPAIALTSVCCVIDELLFLLPLEDRVSETGLPLVAARQNKHVFKVN